MCQFGTCPDGRIRTSLHAFGRMWWISTTAAELRSAGPPGTAVPTCMKRQRREPGLRLRRRLVDEHDGNVVFHPIHAMAVRALQGFGILTIFEGSFALRTNQHIE
jgi:hypothetical protein